MRDGEGLARPNKDAYKPRPKGDKFGPSEGNRRHSGSSGTPIAAPDFPSRVAARFRALQELLLSKHRDYGPTNISRAPGGALNGLRVRIHDKVARINHLIDNDLSPEHESLRDSFRDLANYAVIALLVLDGEWDDDKA